MSDQLILDSVQSIYARITSISKSMSELGGAINGLKTVIQEKVGTLVQQISQMNAAVQKEGEMHADILKNVATGVTKEIQKLQEELGIKSIETIKSTLNTVHNTVKETLKPENVDMLLAEAIAAIKVLQGEKKGEDSKKDITPTTSVPDPTIEPAPAAAGPGKPKMKKP